MTEDQVDAIVREFLAAASADNHRNAAGLAERLRAVALATVAPTPEPGPVFDTIGVAAFAIGLSESQIRKLCKKHPIGEPGGFGLDTGGRWLVDMVCLRAFVQAHPRRLRKKRK